MSFVFLIASALGFRRFFGLRIAKAQSSETCDEDDGQQKSKQHEQLKNNTEKETSLLYSPG